MDIGGNSGVNTPAGARTATEPNSNTNKETNQDNTKDSVCLRVHLPTRPVPLPGPVQVHVSNKANIRDVKDAVSRLPGRPDPERMRIIWSGRACQDSQMVSELFNASSDKPEQVSLHVVVGTWRDQAALQAEAQKPPPTTTTTSTATSSSSSASTITSTTLSTPAPSTLKVPAEQTEQPSSSPSPDSSFKTCKAFHDYLLPLTPFERSQLESGLVTAASVITDMLSPNPESSVSNSKSPIPPSSTSSSSSSSSSSFSTATTTPNVDGSRSSVTEWHGSVIGKVEALISSLVDPSCKKLDNDVLSQCFRAPPNLTQDITAAPQSSMEKQSVSSSSSSSSTSPSSPSQSKTEASDAFDQKRLKLLQHSLTVLLDWLNHATYIAPALSVERPFSLNPNLVLGRGLNSGSFAYYPSRQSSFPPHLQQDPHILQPQSPQHSFLHPSQPQPHPQPQHNPAVPPQQANNGFGFGGIAAGLNPLANGLNNNMNMNINNNNNNNHNNIGAATAAAAAAAAAAATNNAPRRRLGGFLILDLDALIRISIPLIILSLKLSFLLYILTRNSSPTKRALLFSLAMTWILWEALKHVRRRPIVLHGTGINFQSPVNILQNQNQQQQQRARFRFPFFGQPPAAAAAGGSGPAPPPPTFQQPAGNDAFGNPVPPNNVPTSGPNNQGNAQPDNPVNPATSTARTTASIPNSNLDPAGPSTQVPGPNNQANPHATSASAGRSRRSRSSRPLMKRIIHAVAHVGLAADWTEDQARLERQYQMPPVNRRTAQAFQIEQRRQAQPIYSLYVSVTTALFRVFVAVVLFVATLVPEVEKRRRRALERRERMKKQYEDYLRMQQAARNRASRGNYLDSNTNPGLNSNFGSNPISRLGNTSIPSTVPRSNDTNTNIPHLKEESNVASSSSSISPSVSLATNVVSASTSSSLTGSTTQQPTPPPPPQQQQQQRTEVENIPDQMEGAVSEDVSSDSEDESPPPEQRPAPAGDAPVVLDGAEENQENNRRDREDDDMRMLLF